MRASTSRSRSRRRGPRVCRRLRRPWWPANSGRKSDGLLHTRSPRTRAVARDALIVHCRDGRRYPADESFPGEESYARDEIAPPGGNPNVIRIFKGLARRRLLNQRRKLCSLANGAANCVTICNENLQRPCWCDGGQVI